MIYLKEAMLTHICHTTCHASKKAFLRIMNRNIKISDMGMAAFIEEYVVGFEVAEEDIYT